MLEDLLAQFYKEHGFVLTQEEYKTKYPDRPRNRIERQFVITLADYIDKARAIREFVEYHAVTIGYENCMFVLNYIYRTEEFALKIKSLAVHLASLQVRDEGCSAWYMLILIQDLERTVRRGSNGNPNPLI